MEPWFWRKNDGGAQIDCQSVPTVAYAKIKEGPINLSSTVDGELLYQIYVDFLKVHFFLPYFLHHPHSECALFCCSWGNQGIFQKLATRKITELLVTVAHKLLSLSPFDRLCSKKVASWCSLLAVCKPTNVSVVTTQNNTTNNPLSTIVVNRMYLYAALNDAPVRVRESNGAVVVWVGVCAWVVVGCVVVFGRSV
eukprot:TRINITY_DN67660_c5_g1_i1.p3 TRINITY_DN67660_c5_g1~~TRINITY_DN67660_c5_g1_i1.p3  ORF type:complete len:195 (+),score=11.78 TRINITY_DN67660_c5_g1_i1:740-1324(+)